MSFVFFSNCQDRSMTNVERDTLGFINIYDSNFHREFIKKYTNASKLCFIAENEKPD